MFIKFNSKDERRRLYDNSTAFIELQYCKMSKESKIKTILSTRHAKYWKSDSLYIYLDNIELFVENYSEILNDGTYDNPETGLFDIYGYYYYNKNDVEKIINKILDKKPKDYDKFLKWLEVAKSHNGFYFVGI